MNQETETVDGIEYTIEVINGIKYIDGYEVLPCIHCSVHFSPECAETFRGTNGKLYLCPHCKKLN